MEDKQFEFSVEPLQFQFSVEPLQAQFSVEPLQFQFSVEPLQAQFSVEPLQAQFSVEPPPLSFYIDYKAIFYDRMNELFKELGGQDVSNGELGSCWFFEETGMVVDIAGEKIYNPIYIRETITRFGECKVIFVFNAIHSNGTIPFRKVVFNTMTCKFRIHSKFPFCQWSAFQARVFVYDQQTECLNIVYFGKEYISGAETFTGDFDLLTRKDLQSLATGERTNKMICS